MRRSLLVSNAVLAAVGAVVGAVVALVLTKLADSPRGDFGWYAYSPLTNATNRRYVDYSSPGVSWWRLLSTSAGVGLVAGLVLGLVLTVGGVRISRVSRSSPTGSARR